MYAAHKQILSCKQSGEALIVNLLLAQDAFISYCASVRSSILLLFPDFPEKRIVRLHRHAIVKFVLLREPMGGVVIPKRRRVRGRVERFPARPK
jgi:hypothetical protein